VIFLEQFKKFKCKIYQYNLKQAEMVKMAINLFLFNSVSYANLLDNYCRQFNFKFSDINESIRSDRRIGINAYISPSLGLSGGHLERDVYTTIKTIKDKYSKKIFLQLEKMNNSRINLLIKKFQYLYKLKKYKKIIWAGPSYKLNSFSIVNSPYFKFKKYLKTKKINLLAFDSIFNLKKQKISFTIKKLDKKNLKDSLVIFNYLNKKDKKNLTHLMQNKVCDTLNINFLNKKKEFLNY
jgi:UDP-glucose 6-dehydrogenase